MKLTAHLRTTQGKVLAASAAAAMTVTMGVVAVAASEPAVAFADGYGTGDGLNRYVVTLAATASAPVSSTGAPATAPVPALEPVAGATDPVPSAVRGADLTRGRLDVELLKKALADLGPGGDMVQVDGIGYYVTDTSAMVVSPGGDGSVLVATAVPGHTEPAPAAPVVPAAPAPTAGQDALDALTANPAVDSAQWVDGGQVLIATSLDTAAVRALPGVSDVARSVQVPVAADPNDPYYAPYGWNLRNTGSNAYGQSAKAGADINAPAGWEATQGQGTVVAVVDTGFDSDHPDLAGVLWNNPTEACGTVDTNANGKAGDCHGWNFYKNTADIDNGTEGSHGTTVAGTIAANFNNGAGSTGVAPGVQVMPLVVGGGETVDVNLASQAIRYAADNGADVINGSFGGAFSGTALTALTSAVDYAISKGVVVVVAAGNDAGDRDVNKLYPANLANPALITVGSSTAVDTPAASSAYGATSVDLFAPGDKVFTTWNDGDYRLVSGTSIAAPHVAAAAAMHLSLHPDLTPAQVRDQLLADSVKLASLTGKCVSGGRLTVGTLAAVGGGADYTFSGMVAQPGTQHPQVKVTSLASRGTYQVTFGLAMLVEGQVWAVSGEDVTFAGATKTTDDSGAVTFDMGVLDYLGSPTLAPSLTLGNGQFGLTVQILKDGQPLTRPYAAPLLVTPAAPTPTDPGTGGGTSPTPTDPGTGGGTSPTPTDPGGGTQPGTTTPTDPGTGGSTTPTDPGTGGGTSPTPTDPGTGGGTQPGTTTPTDPGTGGSTTPTDPGTGGGTSPTPTDPGTGGGTSPTPTDPGTGGSTTPAPGGSTTPTTPTPSGPDTKTFDKVGAFQITSIDPVHVSVAGGDTVTIRGAALESGLSVRVGSTGYGDVLVSDASTLVFRTPARVEGVFDVTVYKAGRSSVLPAALVYGTGASSSPTPGDTTDPGTGGSTTPTDPGTGGSTTPAPGGSTTPAPGGSTTPAPGDTTDPGTGGATTPAPGDTTDPGTGGSTTPAPGGSTTPAPGGSTSPAPGSGSTPQTPNATRVGPNGERLVRNDSLAALSGLWSLQCSTSCSGQQV